MGNDISSPPPPPTTRERKLAEILSADVVGYSSLMSADEAATLDTLTAHRVVTDALIAQHHGRIVNTAGDSVLAEFASAVDAVQCAVEIQQALKTRNAELPVERKMEFRIGLNVGDVLVAGEDLFGDGVNIAARLQALADPGGVFISGTVYDQVKTKLALPYEDLGVQTVKNIAEPVRTYRVVLYEVSSPPVEQASSLHAARMAAPPKGQGEGTDREAESQKAKGKNQKAKVEKRTSSARLQWVVIGSALVAATIGAVRYLSPPTPSTQSLAPSTQPPIPNPQSLPLPDKPSIVILPFVNLSNDPEQEYFSDGLTEDLTSALSRLSSLFVIARNSAFTYKGKAVKVQEVSKELGVRYVLEGSVRKADNQVRITAQLIDATTGGHLWSEHYDRPLQDIFALQDEIVQKIVTTLKLQLTLQEQGVLVRKTTNNLEAYDYFLRGMEHFLRRTKEANTQARQLFEKAISLDPEFAEAYAWLGGTYYWDRFNQWSADPAQSLERALELAQQAVRLDDSLPTAHVVLSAVYRDKKQYEQALAEAEQAITLAPNSSQGYVALGGLLNLTGHAEKAIGVIEQAQRLDPHSPVLPQIVLGWAYLLARQYDKAIATQQKVLSRNRNLLDPHLILTISYSELGREEEARAEAGEVLRISPKYSLDVVRQTWPYKDPADMERTLAALRKTGLK